MNLRDQILKACRADAIPAGESGLWHVRKIDLSSPFAGEKEGRPIIVPSGSYTQLWRWTDSTLQAALDADGVAPPGELVMNDQEDELLTHMDFMLRAWGRVLVTGLGLGCCVRGLLVNPRVSHVTVIENSPDVLALVRPHMPQTERLSIIEAEALEWTARHGRPFDCAWHDLWTDTDAGEPHLQVWHSKLLVETMPHMKLTGAWAMPRRIRRAWNDMARPKGKYIA